MKRNMEKSAPSAQKEAKRGYGMHRNPLILLVVDVGFEPATS
jgi:hypothetical protein